MHSFPSAEPLRVATLYRFSRLERYESLRAPLAAFCRGRGIKGTLLLAPEGINGTVAGASAAIDDLIAELEAIPEFAGLDVKYSSAREMPFYRMKVRLKREIVTMGVDDMDPTNNAGDYVEAADWNALIADPRTVVIDTRNDYEVRLGTFEGAVNPRTASFREFPGWVDAHRGDLEGRQIAMFCTGGIRCEKATAYVKSLGIGASVHHLKGGILGYLEATPNTDSRWRGECFVFDERVAVTHGLAQGDAESCRACRIPLTQADRASPYFSRGISCAHCFDTRNAADRERYAERQRQVERAAALGAPHPLVR